MRSSKTALLITMSVLLNAAFLALSTSLSISLMSISMVSILRPLLYNFYIVARNARVFRFIVDYLSILPLFRDLFEICKIFGCYERNYARRKIAIISVWDLLPYQRGTHVVVAVKRDKDGVVTVFFIVLCHILFVRAVFVVSYTSNQCGCPHFFCDVHRIFVR